MTTPQDDADDGVLVLTLADVDRLENGQPAQLRLNRRGAEIGRSPSADWSLPDPNSHISSRHCEIEYRQGGYLLTDKSTNGAFLNGAKARLAAPHRLERGDVFAIGRYRIEVDFEAAPPLEQGAEAPDRTSAPAPKPAPVAWGPIGADASPSALPAIAGPTSVPEGFPDAWSALLRAAGVSAEAIKATPDTAGAAAGLLLRELIGGLVLMLEARARAKAQLGAASTTLELNGNNPLKFARSPERVLQQLLNPPERGFMGAAEAVEDSLRDLEAHQTATLAAMQAALQATVARFAPEAVRERAETGGVVARLLPSARDAALWQAYERDYGGVADGSDDAFMTAFATAFGQAYARSIAAMKAEARPVAAGDPPR